MKKLLYSIALVALVNNYGFGQSSCTNTSSAVEFSNVPTNVLVSGQSGFFNVKVSVLTGSPGTLQYYSIKTISVSTSGGHTNSYTYSGYGTSEGTVNFKVVSPNSPGTESLTVTVVVNSSLAGDNGACSVVGLTSFNTTPIELLAFNGKQNNEGGVHLDWVTASEKNNAKFLVERSNNGNDFTQIGEVKGAGNSSKNINYTFNDGSAVNDAVNYYRLTDVDLNGVKTPSRIISVVVGKNAPLSIYTISAQQGWVSVVSPIAGDAVLNITNAQGQVMSSMKANLTEGDNQVSINTANLNTGIYILSINNNNRTAQTKFFKN